MGTPSTSIRLKSRVPRPDPASASFSVESDFSNGAVPLSLMGFDPMAERGTAPFEKSDCTLKLAEQIGLGTRDLRRIEVLGVPIAKARIDFRKA